MLATTVTLNNDGAACVSLEVDLCVLRVGDFEDVEQLGEVLCYLVEDAPTEYGIEAILCVDTDCCVSGARGGSGDEVGLVGDYFGAVLDGDAILQGAEV